MKYVCKYTPVELLAGFGIRAEMLNPAAENYELSNQYIHSNVCSFSHAVIEERLMDFSDPIILTSCCDSMERTSDVLRTAGQQVYLLSLPHGNNCCGKLLYKKELLKFMDRLCKTTGKDFSAEDFYSSFRSYGENVSGKYIAVMGARVNPDLLELINKESPFPVKNNTCTGMRLVPEPPRTDDIDQLMTWYSDALLSQIPCSRMLDTSGRRHLTEDPNLCGIIYNTVNFCDFYSFEYSVLKSCLKVPILKMETDYTLLAAGQIKTRLRAFYENLVSVRRESSKTGKPSFRACYAGIDSGSTSTNAVIIDENKNIISFASVPTGVRVAESARKALNAALKKAGLEIGDISRIVTTGYGRERIDFRSEDVTEITCHAKGAYFLNPAVRTVIDVGGQDSKVIKLDEKGNVIDFVMNDKCAAGTGRFIEMMAQSLQLSLEQMSTYGLHWNEDIVISSTCSVFAQSEVVSLIASDKKPEDIIHGINNSVASRIISLAGRIKSEKEYMMTGGVARNTGVVRAVEEKLNTEILVPEEPDICGALGAALTASEI